MADALGPFLIKEPHPERVVAAGRVGDDAKGERA